MAETLVDDFVEPLQGMPVRVAVFVAALLGAAAAWPLAHQHYKKYPFMGVPREVAVLAEKSDPTAEDRKRIDLFTFRYRSADVVTVMCLFGSFFGGAVGLAYGATSLKCGKAVVGALAGTAVGCTFGCVAGLVGEGVFEAFHRVGSQPNLAKTATFHAAAFAVVGFGLGLAFVVFDEAPRTILGRALGGAAGAALAAILFVPICGIIVPTSKTGYFVPDEGSARLLWFLLNAGLIALGLTVGLRTSSGRLAGTQR